MLQCLKLKCLKHFYKIKLSLVLILLSIFVTFITCGCAKNETEDILTQKVTQDNRTPITILVKYAFSINNFEKIVEEKFPNIDIVQVGNYTANTALAEEYKTRLEHDDLTDIVMTWPLDVGEEYWDDRLIDLSGMTFTSKYNTSMLKPITRDGKLYYLPGPATIRAIVYNKTLFEENGWDVPKNYNEFMDLCQKIEKTGIRSLQLSLGNEEVLETPFIGFNYANSFSKPEDAKWLDNYNKGNGSFGDHFKPSLDVFQELIQKGILKKTDLNLHYQDSQNMLFTRKCAMTEDSNLLGHSAFAQTGSTDEFALMPFFSPGEDGDWARLYMVCYIGLNKHLTESKNKEKYDLVMQLMNYISTPEGQKALSSDAGGMFSSLKGMELPSEPELQPLLQSLEHGRYAIFPTFKNIQDSLRNGLAGMINGTLDKNDVIKMVDKQNTSSSKVINPKIIGNATNDFSMIETGNLITDAMRAKSGCEIALFLDNGKDGRYNGKGVSAKFYKGDITTTDIQRVFPDLKHGETGTLWKITMTGKDLLDTLEHSITVDNNSSGWFYYFSGLKMEYSPTDKPGKRIKKITTTEGDSIDLNKSYSIAVIDYSVPEKYIKKCDKTNIKITDIITEYIEKQKSVSPSEDKRFVVAKP
ncbi:extracellular solute-binding protein [Clostridioides difficile]